MAIVTVSAPTALPPSGAATGDLTDTFPAPTIAASAVTSTKIADGAIVNADVNAAAGIVASKLAGVVSGPQTAIADMALASTGIGAVDTVLAAIQTKFNVLLSESRTAGLLAP